MPQDWSDAEVKLIVADYFSMLIDELTGKVLNKSFHRKALFPLLNNRTASSIEFKHQNISAVLVEMNIPFIRGYLPRDQFQRSKLIPAVRGYLKLNPNVQLLFGEFANDSSFVNKGVKFENWLVTAPEIKKDIRIVRPAQNPVKINYLEREQNNRLLGMQGEELAIQFEKNLLIKSGKEALAEKIEWVSKEQGDGLGFDILSRNLNGTDKYIEVKTTKLSKEAPFFFTSNEFNFSIKNEGNFHLYRIFDFNINPKMFQLKGRYDAFCRIEPVGYKGRF
ncbi:DUF3883 domain-containing protein [Pedobacter sp. Leaf176]|uniref:DUF3883 domain-containing protein n=1 Tax=Pedobacter sp. Leaf176 TaxID=1736286 RepID=UPI0006FE07E9|nr:DUF3883 domain-containing protein [Pedobacter sp. Leaf176]KQR67486.1 hypothetical protein ASF92_17515 [Pedobacter sp. Leaf176]